MKKVYEKFCKFEQALAIFLLSLITVLVFAAALTRTFGSRSTGRRMSR